MAEDDRNFWKLTSIALVIAAVVAVVTGIVVANRTGPADTRVVVVAPSASPATTVDDPKVTQTPSDERYRSAYIGCMKTKGYTA
jgi:anti-sigma-K factor RskA